MIVMSINNLASSSSAESAGDISRSAAGREILDEKEGREALSSAGIGRTALACRQKAYSAICQGADDDHRQINEEACWV